MPQPRRPSDHPHAPRRRGRGQGDDTERVRIPAARGNQAVTVGAVVIAVIGGVLLWVMWSRSTPVVMVPPAAAPAPAPGIAPAPPTHGSPPAPAVAKTFARGIAFGTAGVTIAGQRWLGLAQAQANGLELAAGTAAAPPASIAASRLDFETKTMLDGGLAARGPVKLSQALPNGDYEVTLWVAGAQGVDASLLALRLDGSDVAVGAVTGAATWRRLGPYPVGVRHRLLAISLDGLGAAHLAGLALTALGSGEATVPPVVGLTSPGPGAQLYSGDIPLIADPIPGTGRLAKVEFFDGATRLGEALAPPWTWTWSHPASGRHELSAVASDVAAARASSAPVAMTIKADDGSPDLRIERAKDALRGLGLESSLLVQDADGLHLSLRDTTITDIAWLTGVPLTDLDIRGSRLTDLSALAGMPLRRLLMNDARPRDFTFLKGLPLTELRVWNCGMPDFAPLAGMRLELLEAGKNPVTDLRPLAGMPLRYLYLQHNAIVDLAPLAGLAKLEDLDIGGTRVRDLAPLAGLPLLQLRLWGCPLASLAPLAGVRLKLLNISGCNLDCTPLRGMPLEELTIGESTLSDLAPFAGMPLRRLDLWNSHVVSLAPLAGMKLEMLRMGYTPVTDLAPLAGMPLVELDLRGSEMLGSLAPVATLASLRSLGLPAHRPDLDRLRSLGNVQIHEIDRPESRDVGVFFTALDAANGKQ